MTVLMVDDEPLTIQTLAKNIDWAHLGVSATLLAFNAEQAKELFDASDKIDIILCDIEMPGTDGFSLLQWVREHHSETKMVIITNHAVFRYAQQAVHLGCVDYLTKPLNPEAVSEMLRAIIKEKTDRLVSLAENEAAKRNALWHDMLSNRFSNTAASFPAEKICRLSFHSMSVQRILACLAETAGHCGFAFSGQKGAGGQDQERPLCDSVPLADRAGGDDPGVDGLHSGVMQNTLGAVGNTGPRGVGAVWLQLPDCRTSCVSRSVGRGQKHV